MSKLNGKRAAIIGVANERSLAWGIAKKLSEQGCELAFTYLNEKLERRVRPLAESVNAKIIAPLDVNDPSQVESFFSEINSTWGQLDVLIHSIAFAEREDLEGRFVDTSREGFLKAMDISAYSLVSLAQKAEPLMTEGGSLVTLSYLGAVKVIPNYNVMGVAKAALEACVRYLAYDLGKNKIRVNAISAGPVKTLSASGIKNFRSILTDIEDKTPLGENIDAEDVGELGAFLSSPASKHITGTTIYLDSGAHIV